MPLSAIIEQYHNNDISNKHWNEASLTIFLKILYKVSILFLFNLTLHVYVRWGHVCGGEYRVQECFAEITNSSEKLDMGAETWTLVLI